jgi:hypothetical protein
VIFADLEGELCKIDKFYFIDIVLRRAVLESPIFSCLRTGILIIKRTFRRFLQKNNIFLAIVFGELFENLQLLSQLKLRGCELKVFQ